MTAKVSMSEPGEFETLESAREVADGRSVPLTELDTLDDLGYSCDASLRLCDPLGLLRQAHGRALGESGVGVLANSRSVSRGLVEPLLREGDDGERHEQRRQHDHPLPTPDDPEVVVRRHGV